jgi:nicotinate-nucleotide adenylyltransferase
MSKKSKRIGIFAGTFNPIHSGHISFALQALETAGIDKIYLMPERRPRHKTNVEHYGHRVAMIRRALLPHPRLEVLETDDVSFTVNRTLPRLKNSFKGSELIFLVGSDVVPHILDWPGGSKLLAEHELIIGQRADMLETPLIEAPVLRRLQILDHPAPEISSREVRKGLRERRYVRGLLSSVVHYSNRNWLYVSVG